MLCILSADLKIKREQSGVKCMQLQGASLYCVGGKKILKGNKLHLFCLIWLSLRLVPLHARWGCRGTGGGHISKCQMFSKGFELWQLRLPVTFVSAFMKREPRRSKKEKVEYVPTMRLSPCRSGAKMWPMIPNLLATNLGLSPFAIFKKMPGYNSELKANFRPWWFSVVALTGGTLMESSASIG